MVKKDDRQTNVRLPADLKDRITEAASAASRSFTAELVARLEASFDSFLQRRVQELEQKLADAEKSFDTKFTYQLLERRAMELGECTLEWVRVSGELRELKKERVEGHPDDRLEEKIARKAQEAELLKRQHDRMAEDFDALMEDVRSSLPKLGD